MSKAGQRLIQAAKEAAAIARFGMERDWEYESAGDFTFRVAPRKFAGRDAGWMSEAVRGSFQFNTNLIDEMLHTDCYFEYGKTRDEAMQKLKRELLS